MTSHKGLVNQAAEYLAGEGFTVLDRDWGSTEGTADIVAEQSRSELVVVLVQSAMTPVSKPRARRMRRVAVAWLAAHGKRADRVRVDVVAIRFEGTGGYTVEHERGVA